MARARSLLMVVVVGAFAVGCAGLLGLDEVTASSEADGGRDGQTDMDGAIEGASTSETGADATMGDGDATTDPDSDAAVDAPIDAFDAGCGAVVATDFTSVTLPPQATEAVDATGSTLVYDLSGVGGTRAMHVKVPVGSTNAGLLVAVQALATDGALKCAVTCGLDLKLINRGTAAIEMAMEGTSLSAHLSHSATFTYFSRAEQGLEAPSLGTLPLGAFVHLEIDVSGAAAPFTGKASLAGTTNTKPLMFLPNFARIGLEKASADPEVEAIVDNVVCRSRLP